MRGSNRGSHSPNDVIGNEDVAVIATLLSFVYGWGFVGFCFPLIQRYFFIKYYTYSIREIAVIIIIIIIRIIQPRQLSDAVFGIIVLHGVISHPFFFFWLYIVLPIHHHHYHNHNITLIPIRSKRPPIFFRIYIYIISNTFICFDTLTY